MENVIKSLKELRLDQIKNKKLLFDSILENKIAIAYGDDDNISTDIKFTDDFLVEEFLWIYLTMEIIHNIDGLLEDEKSLNEILEDFEGREINKDSLLEYLQELG